MLRPSLPPLILAILLAGPALASDPGTLQQKDTMRDAVAAPLEDLNLKQTAIPAVLQRAVQSPYDLTELTRCEGIAGEVGRLDAALGPDLDEAPPPDARSRGKKVADAAWGAGVGEVRNTTQHALPFRGWIRRLTGAAKHDRAVQAAVQAGGVRRGYLKGVGMRMNCAPPAAPSWFVPAPPPAPPKAVVAPGPWDWMAAVWNGVVGWWRGWWPF
jgi:hypothetical protein